MPRPEVKRLTKELTVAALREVSAEAGKMPAAEHADCQRPGRRDKFHFGCCCRLERGRLLRIWDKAVDDAAERMAQLRRRQLMKWELEEARLRRRLTRRQKRAGQRFVFAPRDMDAAVAAVREVKLAMLADDMDLERAVVVEGGSTESE